jgi:hypothetical protein
VAVAQAEMGVHLTKMQIAKTAVMLADLSSWVV